MGMLVTTLSIHGECANGRKISFLNYKYYNRNLAAPSVDRDCYVVMIRAVSNMR